MEIVVGFDLRTRIYKEVPVQGSVSTIAQIRVPLIFRFSLPMTRM